MSSVSNTYSVKFYNYYYKLEDIYENGVFIGEDRVIDSIKNIVYYEIKEDTFYIFTRFNLHKIIYTEHGMSGATKCKYEKLPMGYHNFQQSCRDFSYIFCTFKDFETNIITADCSVIYVHNGRLFIDDPYMFLSNNTYSKMKECGKLKDDHYIMQLEYGKFYKVHGFVYNKICDHFIDTNLTSDEIDTTKLNIDKFKNYYGMLYVEGTKIKPLEIEDLGIDNLEYSSYIEIDNYGNIKTCSLLNCLPYNIKYCISSDFEYYLMKNIQNILIDFNVRNCMTYLKKETDLQSFNINSFIVFAYKFVNKYLSELFDKTNSDHWKALSIITNNIEKIVKFSIDEWGNSSHLRLFIRTIFTVLILSDKKLDMIFNDDELAQFEKLRKEFGKRMCGKTTINEYDELTKDTDNESIKKCCAEIQETIEIIEEKYDLGYDIRDKMLDEKMLNDLDIIGRYIGIIIDSFDVSEMKEMINNSDRLKEVCEQIKEELEKEKQEREEKEKQELGNSIYDKIQEITKDENITEQYTGIIIESFSIPEIEKMIKESDELKKVCKGIKEALEQNGQDTQSN